MVKREMVKDTVMYKPQIRRSVFLDSNCLYLYTDNINFFNDHNTL